MTFQLAVSLESTVSGPLNPAIMTMHFGTTAGTAPLSLPETAVRAIAYVAAAVAVMSEGGVKMTGIEAKTEGTPGSASVPFPTTEWAAFRGSYGSFESAWVPMTGYNVSLNGSGNTSSGRGDSACLSLKGTGGGRSAQGRSFVPYISRQTIGSDGLLDAANCQRVKEAYYFVFLEQNLRSVFVPPAAALAVVYSRKSPPAARPVFQAQFQRIPSRLRSRTK